MKLPSRRVRFGIVAGMFATIALITAAYAQFVPRAYADVNGPWTYTISDSEVTINEYDFDSGGPTPAVPSSLGGFPVVVLGIGLFAGMDITAVTLPNTLQTIESSAFSDTDLTSVNLPNSLKAIGDSSFNNTPLTSIDFPDSLETIGSGAFYNVPLTSISIPDSVVSIQPGAFANTSASTVTVGTPGFSGTPSLTISSGAFASMTAPVTVTIYNNLASIESYALPFGTLTSLTIGTDDFTGTPSVVIPSGFVSGNSSLTTVNLGKNILSIGDHAFSFSGLTTVKLSEGLTNIGSSAFADTPLTSLELPSTITAIQDDAFRGTAITSLDIPSTILSIGDRAFQDAPINSLTIHEGTTRIGIRAFAGTNITTFTLPVSATSLGDGIFENSRLEHLTIGSTSFTGEPTFEVPSYSFSNMTSIKTVTFGKNVKSIGDSAFSYSTGTLEAINLSEGIERIGDYAFLGTGITSLTLPSSLTAIGNGAFNSTHLTSLAIPSTVTSIGNNAFASIRELSNVTVGDPNYTGTPTFALPDAFVGGASALSSVTLGKNIVSIGAYAFDGTAKLRSLTIPETVTSIGDNAFINSGITSLTILGNPTTEANTFMGAGLDIADKPDDVLWGSPLYSYQQNNAELLQIHAPNPAFATSLGRSKLNTNQVSAHVYSSTNSGDTWSPVTTPTTSSWDSITGSADASKLIAKVSNGGEAEGAIYGTDNGGTTWSLRKQYAEGETWFGNITSSSNGSLLVATRYNSGNSTTGNVFTSTDSGITWTPRTTPSNAGRFSAVASSADGTKLVAVANRPNLSTNTNVYTSTDSGVTWTARTTPSSRYWSDVTSSDNGTYLIAMPNGAGQLYVSSDSGASWTARGASKSWRGLSNSSTGQYAVAIAGNSAIYTSSDYGATWTERPASGTRFWTSVSMSGTGQYIVASDSNNGGFSADDGRIYYSTDYGVTWSEKPVTGKTQNWTSVFISDDGSKIYAVNLQSEYATTEGSFATSGYIVNPASVDASFVNSMGTSLRSPLHYTARVPGANGAEDTYRTDYKLKDALNPANTDEYTLLLDPYFFKGGSSFTLTPQSVGAYVTPSAFSYTFANSGINQHEFVYALAESNDNPGDDESSEGENTGSNQGGTSNGDTDNSTTDKDPRVPAHNSAGGGSTANDTPLSSDQDDKAVDSPDDATNGQQPVNNESSDDKEATDIQKNDGIHPAWVMGGGATTAILLWLLIARLRRHATTGN